MTGTMLLSLSGSPKIEMNSGLTFPDWILLVTDCTASPIMEALSNLSLTLERDACPLLYNLQLSPGIASICCP